jgi:cytoskeletal protein CcmA (bactofilin family)
MWRQKPEDLPISGHVPTPDPLRTVVTRHAETVAPSPSVAAPAGQASIRKGITVRGEISGTDSLCVEGIVEGTICLPGQRVTLGREGRMIAPHGVGSAPCIRAREIVILGAVTGNIEAEDRVDMRAQGSLSGDVSTRRVSIEDGAFFRGGIDILRDQALPTAPAVAPAVAAPGQEPDQSAVPAHAAPAHA